MQDFLVFSAVWKSKPMVAAEMKEFLMELARVSPWWTPFDVSGRSQRLAHMPIAEDYSDFEENVFKAMDNKDIRFFSQTNPDTMRLKPDSKSVFGMRATFSDYPQKKQKKSMVQVEVGMGSSDASCN